MKKLKLYTIASALVLSLGITLTSCSDSDGSSDFYSNGGDGQGGSMARFTISGDQLYTVDNYKLMTFDISDPAQPEYLDRRDQVMNFGIETIFTKGDLLFIGSQDGMYIFDISRPQYPQQISHVSHIRSCDPVVASGNYAYVTLNTQNSWCGNNSNQLDIYDIADPWQPKIVFTDNTLQAPKGLGVDANYLFVCDAKAGIKIYDISNPERPVWKGDLSGISQMDKADTYDVIPRNGLLLVSASDGFYQLDYSHWQAGDPSWSFNFVSKIAVNTK